jgi:hypothetical protein
MIHLSVICCGRAVPLLWRVLEHCKDFAPRITERRPFGGASDYESFSEVVSAVNQWIDNGTIQVINVEIVVLPIGLKAPVMMSTE